MNDCLSLPHRQGAGGTRRLEGWQSLWMPLGEGEEKGLPAGRGKGWEPAEVPGQRLAHEGQSALWYRCSFPRPDHSGRVLLRFGGAFLAANVWLNGRLLGSHYGYFAPFGFDITSHLTGDNLLVVCCESPIETDLTRKKHVMGIFNDGESRPYPPSAYFSLPEPYRWEVPVGLWRAVELEYAGAVVLDWLRLRPRLEAGDLGVLEAEARLRNLDGRDMAGEITFSVEPDGAAPIRLQREYRVPGGLEQTATFTVPVPGARRWLPWRLGEAALHQARLSVAVEGRPSASVSDQFGFRDVDIRARPDGWEIRVGGRPFFVRGANYQPELRLDRLAATDFEADIALAREAGLDALRVHGHVLPEDFYRAADRAGLLVFADFPLTGAYCYHASGEESQFFEAAVREQVPELVSLLGNRPSICLWAAHDDPPWIAANESLADVHSVRQNYSIDQEARALFEKLDPTRPALAAWGELDLRVRAGWSEGGWERLAELEPALVSEFGAQALPALDSPAFEGLGRRWPVADDDPAWLYAGFQPFEWSEQGAGLPSDFESLEEFVEAGQEHQAWLVRFAIDQFRRRKLQPCWGAFVHQFVDPFPGVGFGLLDHERRPKPAFEALRQALAPTRLVVDPVGFEPGDGAVRYRPGAPVTLRFFVVNDAFDLAGRARVRWSLQRVGGLDRGGVGGLRDAFVRRSYSGSADFTLPNASQPALLVERLAATLALEGDYVLQAELSLGAQVLDTCLFPLEVRAGPPPARPVRPVPRYLADLLVDRSSLATHALGLGFELVNRARPAALTALSRVVVDGEPQTDQRVLTEISGRVLPLPKRLELPLGRPLRLIVDLGEPLRAGRHSLEFDLTVPGVASGRIRLEGLVRPEEFAPRAT